MNELFAADRAHILHLLCQGNLIRAVTRPTRADLPVLTQERDAALIREAGFSDVALFYAALTFRGWLARA